MNIQLSIRLAATSAALLVLGNVASADLLFDQGPSTGSYGGSWQNQTAMQNFADQFSFSQAEVVTDYIYFSAGAPVFDPATFGTMHVKLLSDGGGAPSGLLDAQDVSVASSSLVDPVNFIYEADLKLTTPWVIPANTTFWAGASGNGFEAAQASVYTPGDGYMAQFAGSTYVFPASVGDQDFQLVGHAVPEPASFAVVGFGALAMLRRKKRA